MKSDSEVKFTSFSFLGEDPKQVRETLKRFVEEKTVLSYNDLVVDALLLSEFYEFVLDSNKENLKKCQHKGIEKALEKKSRGIGEYGRPRTMLPENFDERIRMCLEGKAQLSAYREELQMKRSTFYKYAKESRKRISDIKIIDDHKI